ncbi:hypothetical protein GIB67_010620, partial [Kingdonia uniflora]
MYLTFPLPSTVTWEITVAVFYGDGTALPMPFTITVLKDGSCKDLLEALSTECYLRSDETLLLTEVHAHSIYQYIENPFEELFKIKNVDYLVAYRLSKNQEVSTKLEIVHHSKDKNVFLFFGSLAVMKKKIMADMAHVYTHTHKHTCCHFQFLFCLFTCLLYFKPKQLHLSWLLDFLTFIHLEL